MKFDKKDKPYGTMVKHEEGNLISIRTFRKLLKKVRSIQSNRKFMVVTCTYIYMHSAWPASPGKLGDLIWSQSSPASTVFVQLGRLLFSRLKSSFSMLLTIQDGIRSHSLSIKFKNYSHTSTAPCRRRSSESQVDYW